MTEAKILKQVEFYFSDSNLPKDKFLWESVNKDPQGWLPLSVLLVFNRLKALTTDQEELANAISQSKELLELNEDRTKVRRKTQIQPKSEDNIERSLYIKNIPTSIEKPVEALEAYFSKYEIEPLHINAFRNKNRTFKGEAFVNFKSIEEANKVLEKKLKFNDETELTIMKKSEFPGLKNKKTITRQLKYLPSLISEAEIEALKEMENDKKKKEEEEKNEDKKIIEEGSTLYFTLSTPNVRFDSIKAFFADKSPIVWISKEKDSESGMILFKTKDAEKINEELKEGESKIEENVTIETRLTTSEENEEMSKKFLEFKQAMRSKKGGNGRHGGKFNNKGHFNNKRKAERNPEGAPKAKQEKTE